MLDTYRLDRLIDDENIARILWTLVAVILLHDLFYLWVGLTMPLLGEHSYRQTQTAITAYWARRDGLWLAYETPIMGAPWPVPLELPLYQWLVAGLNAVAVPIDVGGRLLSFVFLVACAWPFAIIRRALALPRVALPLSLAVLLSAPLLVFWGRAVLVETCAVFLALLWLALMVRAFARRRFSVVNACPIALLGCLAVLQKATTFPAFGLLGGGLVAYALLARLPRDRPGALRIFWFGVVTCLVPLAAGIAWVKYSDAVKEQNPFGFLLVSYTMSTWNYGTLAQRHSPELLQALQRGARNILGAGEIVALLALGFACAAIPRYRLYTGTAVVGFLAPFAIFTNLHIVHDYYQVANAVFLVGAVGLALSGIMTHARIAGLVLLVVVVTGQLVFFHQKYARAYSVDYRTDGRYRVAEVAKRRIDPHDAILVLGQDYSSVINYYSERKGIALSSDVPRPLIQRVFDDPEAFLGGMRLGGIVACRPFEFSYGANDALVDAFLARRKVWATEGPCSLYAPTPSP